MVRIIVRIKNNWCVPLLLIIRNILVLFLEQDHFIQETWFCQTEIDLCTARKEALDCNRIMNTASVIVTQRDMPEF